MLLYVFIPGWPGPPPSASWGLPCIWGRGELGYPGLRCGTDAGWGGGAGTVFLPEFSLCEAHSAPAYLRKAPRLVPDPTAGGGGRCLPARATTTLPSSGWRSLGAGHVRVAAKRVAGAARLQLQSSCYGKLGGLRSPARVARWPKVAAEPQARSVPKARPVAPALSPPPPGSLGTAVAQRMSDSGIQLWVTQEFGRRGKSR